MSRFRLLSLLACLVPSITPAVVLSQWTVELGRDASATVRYDGSRVLNFNYVAWGPKWKYADFKPTLGKGDGNTFPIKGEIKPLNTTVTGQAIWQDGKLVFEYDLATGKETKDNIGAAINLTSRLSADLFNQKTIDQPAITPDKKGVSWSPMPGQTISISFDGLARDAAFEKGKPQQVRAWVLPADLAVGSRKVRMTLSLPAGTVFKGMPSSRYAEPDSKTWLPKTVDWTTSPVDLSYLNEKPAGAKGFVKADGERFVFDDGTEVKFWGCNVQAYALFNASNAAIEQQAKRLAALGFNLVRIHHHDSADWVSPNIFDKDANTTQVLDAKSLDRIDYWVKCLKDQGIYVWMDLHVGRPFRAGDNIPAFDELTLNAKTQNRQGKGFNYVNPRITELMKDFAKAYLTHTNPYTKNTYANEPAVMGVLITNENDITDHFGVSFLPDKKLPKHKAMYDKFRDEIVRALKLDGDKAWQTWLPGPSKVVLNQVQYEWSKDFVEYLKKDLGVKVPIATTNTWGSDPLFSLPALTAGDIIDCHSYGAAESLGGNPRHDSNSAFWIAAAQVAGKPVTITEWNTPYPQRDRFTQPLYIAALSAFQGWDAPMIFGYQQSPLNPPLKLAEWGISNDPAMLPLMPAAALLYRRGDVSAAKEVFTLSLPMDKILNEKVSPESSRAIRTLSETHGLRIGLEASPLLPWLTPTPVTGKKITDANYDALGQDADEAVSDTGQLKRNWGDGVFTINTPRTQAAVGWIGGKEITLGDVTFKLDTPKAAVVLSSLDGEPIGTSKKLLLTVAAQASEKKATGIIAEPVAGDVVLTSPAATAVALSPDGKRGTPVEITGNAIDLTGKQATHWYLITR
ncbi:MAG: cellulase family glycosylhydrolase [Tepidisphaeraceae bacterium]